MGCTWACLQTFEKRGVNFREFPGKGQGVREGVG